VRADVDRDVTGPDEPPQFVDDLLADHLRPLTGVEPLRILDGAIHWQVERPDVGALRARPRSPAEQVGNVAGFQGRPSMCRTAGKG
jgi:hypothetical protein